MISMLMISMPMILVVMILAAMSFIPMVSVPRISDQAICIAVICVETTFIPRISSRGSVSRGFVSRNCVSRSAWPWAPVRALEVKVFRGGQNASFPLSLPFSHHGSSRTRPGEKSHPGRWLRGTFPGGYEHGTRPRQRRETGEEKESAGLFLRGCLFVSIRRHFQSVSTYSNLHTGFPSS